MHNTFKRPCQTKENQIPFSDFEVSVSSTLVGEQKKVTKGRFLFWGDVKSSDCPA
jgi:hypothetical protein